VSALLESLQKEFEALPLARREARGRREALASALADGLPGQRSERWKYTPLRALSARSFVLPAATPDVPAEALVAIPAPRLVFVNGLFSAELSMLGELPAGLSVAPLSGALDSGAADSAFAAAFERADEAFARLNSAFATEGALVRVAAGATIEAPLQLVFVGAPTSADVATHLRHRIDVGAGAYCALVEHHLAQGAHRNLDNHLLQVELGEGARVRHARVQDAAEGATLLARTDARLGGGAEYRRIDLELGAALSRHELNVDLAGRGARIRSAGALLAGGRRHLDASLGVRHLVGETSCELLWRGLAAERGKLSFHGGIEILAGADGSDAQLSNKNLLLSANAEIDTQPVLEIHADEVKAAHGATVGRLDERSLFYLRSRGIPTAQARVMLTLAFLREVLPSADAPALVEVLAPRLEARLAALEALA
jgi:Fe-S cluster assembly protein SufD